MPDNLWPANIADANLVTPVSILKEQATLLAEQTRQLVIGEVTTDTTGNLFVHHFYVVAPTLSYRYELFQVSHGISFYPLTLRHLGQPIAMTKNDNFATFKQNLKTIFASESTLNIVHSILSQVRP